MNYLKDYFQYYRQTLFYVVLVFILMLGVIIYLLHEIKDREEAILLLKTKNIELESRPFKTPDNTAQTYYQRFEIWDYEESEKYFR